MESNVRRPFFPAAKDILEDHTDKKVNFEFNNAVKGKPCPNVCLYNDNKACFAIMYVYIMIIKLVLLYNDSGPIYSSSQKTPSSFVLPSKQFILRQRANCMNCLCVYT